MRCVVPGIELYECLPVAYGGCTCSCHTNGGVFHVMPCCYPFVDTNPPCDGSGWVEYSETFGRVSKSVIRNCPGCFRCQASAAST